MKRLFAIALLALGGCLNCYERFPTTAPRIESVYQCTRGAAALTTIASFPQMMGNDRGFRWANLITVPFLGLPCAVDTICEACVDTVLLPVDWPLTAARNKEDR